jgi:hypothetical protein
MGRVPIRHPTGSVRGPWRPRRQRAVYRPTSPRVRCFVQYRPARAVPSFFFSLSLFFLLLGFLLAAQKKKEFSSQSAAAVVHLDPVRPLSLIWTTFFFLGACCSLFSPSPLPLHSSRSPPRNTPQLPRDRAGLAGVRARRARKHRPCSFSFSASRVVVLCFFTGSVFYHFSVYIFIKVQCVFSWILCDSSVRKICRVIITLGLEYWCWSEGY